MISKIKAAVDASRRIKLIVEKFRLQAGASPMGKKLGKMGTAAVAGEVVTSIFQRMQEGRN